MFLKTKEVAEKLSVTKMTISNMVSRGQLKPINSDKRYFLFDAKQVDCLILKNNLMTNPFELLDERLARIEQAILRQPNKSLPETLLSKKETADLLGISLNTLDKYTRNKTIPCYGIGSRIMYKKQEVLASLICINK